MVKSSWGQKRTCPSCGERFYDLAKEPVKCPKCGEKHTLEELLKLQRGSFMKAKKGKKANLHNELPDDEAFESDEATEEVDMIEDASDLGDDNHDMAEVMENIEKGDE